MRHLEHPDAFKQLFGLARLHIELVFGGSWRPSRRIHRLTHEQNPGLADIHPGIVPSRDRQRNDPLIDPLEINLDRLWFLLGFRLLLGVRLLLRRVLLFRGLSLLLVSLTPRLLDSLTPSLFLITLLRQRH